MSRSTSPPTGSPYKGPVDLRSDAVTRPSPAMWKAMRDNPLEWSPGGNETVAKLESRVASLVGKPAALFVPTGTMANTLAMLSWCRPGGTLLAESQAHVLRAEGDAYRRVAGLETHALPGVRGHLTPETVSPVVVGEDIGNLALIWQENTHTFAGGTVASVADLSSVHAIADRVRIPVHLDGARLWNAAVACGDSPADFAATADSVTVNLNKGLGCPGGALLCGPEDLIGEAAERQRGLGGSIAQPGLLAAGGLVALGHIDALGIDHDRARELARELRRLDFEVEEPDSNIILVEVDDAAEAAALFAERGIWVFVRDEHVIRLVTHRDLAEGDIQRVISVARALGGSH